MERYSAYDPLARIYGTHRGFFTKRCLPILDRLVLHRLAPGAAILDLCCGVGDLAGILSERGFRVTGLDGSEEMLRVARDKIPNASFLLADARAFGIASKFDAALSTFNSLNHMMSLDELRAVFSNVNRSLRPGGWFVFDLNLRDGFIDRWKGQSAEVTNHTALFSKMSFDMETELGRAEFAVFEEETDKRWSRRDIVLTQRCYSEADVMASLEHMGFGEAGVEIQPSDSNLSGRGFFYGRRRSEG